MWVRESSPSRRLRLGHRDAYLESASFVDTRKGPKGLRIQVPPGSMIKCSVMALNSVSYLTGSCLKMHKGILLGIYIQTRVSTVVCAERGQPSFRPRLHQNLQRAHFP